MCVMSIFFAFFYDFVLDFGIVPTGWYFLFFVLFTLYKQRIYVFPFTFSYLFFNVELQFQTIFTTHLNVIITPT